MAQVKQKHVEKHNRRRYTLIALLVATLLAGGHFIPISTTYGYQSGEVFCFDDKPGISETISYRVLGLSSTPGAPGYTNNNFLFGRVGGKAGYDQDKQLVSPVKGRENCIPHETLKLYIW